MPDGIYAYKDPVAALNMNYEIDLFGKKTYLIGRTFESYPVIEDAPVEHEIVKEKEEEKKGS